MFIVLLSRLHQLSLSRHHHVNRLKLPLNQKSSSTYTQTLDVIENRGERLLQLQALKNFNCFIRVLKPWKQGQQRGFLHGPCLLTCCVCFTKVNLFISFCFRGKWVVKDVINMFCLRRFYCKLENYLVSYLIQIGFFFSLCFCLIN